MTEPSNIKITKQEIMELPLSFFEGEIHVISSEKGTEQAMGVLKKEKIIGFDTETKPVFKKGVTHSVALLQLSTKTQAFLFQLKQTGLPQCLIELLSSKSTKKVGVAIHDDIKFLQKLKYFEPGGFIELADMAKERKIVNLGLRSLFALSLGGRLSKGAQLSNWENKELTRAQQIYAATDAWAGLLIYLNMEENKDI